MKRKKVKEICRAQFEAVFAEDWKPFFLEGDAMPNFAKSVPGAKRCCVLASGQYFNSVPYPIAQAPDGRIVGGFDVWRNSPDDEEPLNKDWYRVIESPSKPEILFVEGPHKDSEHHFHRIPERYQGAKVIGSEDDGS